MLQWLFTQNRGLFGFPLSLGLSLPVLSLCVLFPWILWSTFLENRCHPEVVLRIFVIRHWEDLVVHFSVMFLLRYWYYKNFLFTEFFCIRFLAFVFIPLLVFVIWSSDLINNNNKLLFFSSNNHLDFTGVL